MVKRTEPVAVSHGGDEPDRSELVRNSAVISLFNGLRVISALVLDVVMAFVFGLGPATDIFFVAITIPQFLTLVLQSSGVNGLVPVLSGLGERDDSDKWLVFSRIFNVIAVTLVILTAAGWILAQLLMSLMGAGLDPALKADVVYQFRILLLMVLPLGLAEVIRAQLYALSRYAVPAASDTVRYIAALVCLLIGGGRWGVAALAWGYVVGAGLQLVMMAVTLIAAGGRYRLSWSTSDPDVRKALHLLLVRASGIGLRRLGLIAERVLASYLPPGSVSALSLARRVSLSIYQVFANSVNAAVLPALSSAATRDDRPALRRNLRLGYRLLSFVTFPSASIVAALSLPVIWVLFQRGAFDVSDTVLTAQLLTVYVLNVPPLALVQVLLAPHYARLDASTPTRHMVWMLALNLLLAWGLMRIMGPVGLALASTLTAYVSAARCHWLLRSMGGLDLGGHLARVVVAACIAAAISYGLWTVGSGSGWISTSGIALVVALISGSVGLGAFLLVGKWLGLRGLRQLRSLAGTS